MKKYELIPIQSRHPDAEPLFQIRALRDVGSDVKAGDLGGIVSGEDNLDHVGACWIYPDASARGNSRVVGDAQVRGRTFLVGHTQVAGAAVVTDSVLRGQAYVTGPSQVTGSTLYDNAAVIDGQVLASYLHGRARVCEGASLIEVQMGGGRVDQGEHRGYTSVLVVGGLPSGEATLTRMDGAAWLRIGCWTGSTDDLRDMIAGDEWPEAEGAQQEERRPGLYALADFADVWAANPTA